MSPRRSSSSRRLLIWVLVVLAVVFALLTAAQGLATNVVSTMVPEAWVHVHRLIISAFGGLAAATGLVAAVIAWLTYRASQSDTGASDHSETRDGPGASRSVMAAGDISNSIVATGDNATIIYLPPPTHDRAPSAPRSRTDILDELAAQSQARTVARWRTAGLPAELARELAKDTTVGALPPQLANFPAGGIAVLEGHLGVGKSLLGERMHQQHIRQARLHVEAPVPVWIRARVLHESLDAVVVAESKGLGDPHQTGAAVVVDGLDEDGSGTAADLIDQARVLVHRWPATQVLLTTRSGVASNDDERINAPLLTDDEADALVQRIAADGESFDTWLWRWPQEARTALRETLRTPLFAVIMGTLRREARPHP